MTNRQTIHDLLARLTEDRHEAEVSSLRRVIAEERARADRSNREATELREMLDDAIESLELLAPVPDPAPGIAPKALLVELAARGLHTHSHDAPVTTAAAWDALRTVLDGVDAVFGRVGDVGRPVEVPAGPEPDADGWYAHDGSTFPSCAPLDDVECRLRDGNTYQYKAFGVIWANFESRGDIIAWRPVRPDGGGQ